MGGRYNVGPVHVCDIVVATTATSSNTQTMSLGIAKAVPSTAILLGHVMTMGPGQRQLERPHVVSHIKCSHCGGRSGAALRLHSTFATIPLASWVHHRRLGCSRGVMLSSGAWPACWFYLFMACALLCCRMGDRRPRACGWWIPCFLARLESFKAFGLFILVLSLGYHCRTSCICIGRTDAGDDRLHHTQRTCRVGGGPTAMSLWEYRISERLGFVLNQQVEKKKMHHAAPSTVTHPAGLPVLTTSTQGCWGLFVCLKLFQTRLPRSVVCDRVALLPPPPGYQ